MKNPPSFDRARFLMSNHSHYKTVPDFQFKLVWLQLPAIGSCYAFLGWIKEPSRTWYFLPLKVLIHRNQTIS